jgi:hypothetical protein
MLAPMTVNIIPIVMMIAARLISRIVMTARFVILVSIDSTPLYPASIFETTPI